MEGTCEKQRRRGDGARAEDGMQRRAAAGAPGEAHSVAQPRGRVTAELSRLLCTEARAEGAMFNTKMKTILRKVV